MWGNSTGWIMSAGVAAVMAFILYSIAVPPSPTTPTNDPSIAVAYTTIKLPVSPDTVAAPGIKEGDAGELYRKAIEDYEIHQKKYSAPAISLHEQDLPGVGFVLAARELKGCTLFRKDLSELINYENTEPVIDNLEKVGTTCCTIGLIYVNKGQPHPNPAKAMQLWEAAFILGVHLYEERVTSVELEAGHGVMQSAVKSMITYYTRKTDITPEEQTRLAELQHFAGDELTYTTKLSAAYHLLQHPVEQTSGKYAGDIFKVAQSSEADPMFRVGAIERIGHFNYDYTNKGDHFLARRVLRKMVQDTNLPASVKAAANAAHDLTREQHNMTGGSA